MLLAIILGIVQGLTEFLPVSSSGHLIVVSWFMDGKPLPLALNLALHVGTLLAVFIYFWRDWWRLIDRTRARVFKGERSFEADRLLPGLLLGTIPAGAIGILWEDDIERLFHNPTSVAIPLAVVGIAIWLVDRKAPATRKVESLTLRDALIIGCAQACALIPGTSRSGATMLAARALGFERGEAAKFSFMLGTPAMCGAVILKGKAIMLEMHHPEFVVGVAVSALVGCLAIGVLLKFLKRFGFGAFAIYRVALAAVIVLLVSRQA